MNPVLSNSIYIYGENCSTRNCNSRVLPTHEQADPFRNDTRESLSNLRRRFIRQTLSILKIIATRTYPRDRISRWGRLAASARQRTGKGKREGPLFLRFSPSVSLDFSLSLILHSPRAKRLLISLAPSLFLAAH